MSENNHQKAMDAIMKGHGRKGFYTKVLLQLIAAEPAKVLHACERVERDNPEPLPGKCDKCPGHYHMKLMKLIAKSNSKPGDSHD